MLFLFSFQVIVLKAVGEEQVVGIKKLSNNQNWEWGLLFSSVDKLLEPGLGQLLPLWFQTTSQPPQSMKSCVGSSYLIFAVVTNKIPRIHFRDTCSVLQRKFDSQDGGGEVCSWSDSNNCGYGLLFFMTVYGGHVRGKYPAFFCVSFYFLLSLFFKNIFQTSSKLGTVRFTVCMILFWGRRFFFPPQS